MSVNLVSQYADATVNVHNVTNMVLGPFRTVEDGVNVRTLTIHTQDGDVEVKLFAAHDGNLAIAELL